MRIQHNIAAMNSLRQLTGNNSAVSKSLEKLSSGYRINRAGDDAAGLAISEKMRAQIRGLSMASKNAQDGISLVQTAEGALTETHSILQRMRELAVQASNGIYADEDREQTQLEIDALKTEVDRISTATTFNGIYLLDGSQSTEGHIERNNEKYDAAFNEALEKLQTANGNVAVSGNITVDAEAGQAGVLAGDVGKAGKVEITFASDIVKGDSFKIGDHIYEFVTNTTNVQNDAEEVYNKGSNVVYIALDTAGADDATKKTTNIANLVAAISDKGTYTTTGGATDNTGVTKFGHVSSNATSATNGTKITITTKTATDEDGLASVILSTDQHSAANNATISYDRAVAAAEAKTPYNATASVEFDFSGKTIADGSTITFTNGALNGTTYKLYNTEDAFDKAGKPANGIVMTDGWEDTIAADLAAALRADTNAGTVTVANGKVTVTHDDSITASDASALIGTVAFASSTTAMNEAQLEAAAKAAVEGTGLTRIDPKNVPKEVQNMELGVVFQIGANGKDDQRVELEIKDMGAEALGIDKVDLRTQTGANAAIDTIDKAINSVSAQRANLGALQNRLEHTINNLDTNNENLTASESRIRDVDMAAEMMKYTQNNVLVQAAQSMLAQANQQPQSVLSLLQ